MGGGVDLMDQQLSYYSLTRHRSLKWWKKIFWHLIDMAVVNSWIIFRTNNPGSSIDTQLKFRIELSRQLVQPLLDLRASPECPPALQRGRRPLSVAKRLIGKHFDPYKSSKKRKMCCMLQEEGGIFRKPQRR